MRYAVKARAEDLDVSGNNERVITLFADGFDLEALRRIYTRAREAVEAAVACDQVAEYARRHQRDDLPQTAEGVLRVVRREQWERELDVEQRADPTRQQRIELEQRVAEATAVLHHAHDLALAPEPTPAAIRDYDAALRAYVLACDRLQAWRDGEAERARRRRTPYWDQREQETAADLRAQYGDRGPQYELLIRRLAAANTRIERAEEEEDGTTLQTYARLQRDVLDAVGQLQRYTESEKREVTSPEIEQAVFATLRIVGAHLEATQPRLWLEIVSDIRRTLTPGAPPHVGSAPLRLAEPTSEEGGATQE
jgi:hypothetical protein